MSNLSVTPGTTGVVVAADDGDSAIAWSAVLAGAAAAAALSLVLVVLGAGLGFSTISPWAGSGVSATTLGVSTVVWLIVVQWAAAMLGGYLAGRLRKRSTRYGDETFFRDTAHGFLAWCAATLFSAAFLASALSSVVGTGAQALATGAGQMAGSALVSQAQQQSSPLADPAGYFVDALFRADRTSVPPPAPDARAEAARIILRGLATGEFPGPDRSYLAQLVAARTNLAEPEAQRRVEDVVRQVQVAERTLRDAADRARQAAAVTSIALALSLFVGAFIASVAAAFAGRLRDEA